MIKKLLQQALLLSLLLSGYHSAQAHHSHANLNRDDIRTYSGIVTRYSWTMPHVFLKVKAPDKNGNVVEYSIEMLHPPAMAKRGWEKKSFAKGDLIIFQEVGSYSVVMKPPFILPDVAIIEFEEKSETFKTVRDRQTFDNIFRNFRFFNK